MGAYSPLAVKIFGSPHIGHHLKLIFKQALVLSTLIFNAHVRVLDGRCLSILNCVYMRVVRRIVNCCRFNSDTFCDLEVRKLARVPSLDCLIQRARLNYLVRLLVHEHRPLIALLSIRLHGGRVLPWVEQIRQDLRDLHDGAHGIQDVLSHPDDDPGA
eukprot:4533990-Karenia_brevis.AAC.1